MSQCKGEGCTHESHAATITDKVEVKVNGDLAPQLPAQRKPNRRQVRKMMRSLGYFKQKMPNALKGIR
jgi:hypothetical protein